MVATTKYLVIYHAVSAGQNGPNLGCDEEEIVMIVYLVLDVAQNKVILVVRVISEILVILVILVVMVTRLTWSGDSLAGEGRGKDCWSS